MKTDVDVLVIGGGIAGLYAAYKCLQMQRDVLVLEKTDRLGGRIRTIYTPFQYEAGAGRFHHNHVILRNLLHSFDLHEVPLGRKKQYEGTPSPEKRLIHKVLEYGGRLEPKFLHYTRFLDLCQYVLGPMDTQLLCNAFGYNAEFEVLNAYDGLRLFKKDFDGDSPYYICAEGLSALVEKLQQVIGSDSIHNNTRVSNIYKQKDGTFRVAAVDSQGNLIYYHCQTVICALPKNDMEGMKLFNKYQRDLLDTVVPIPLHRIYGQFPLHGHGKDAKPWFHGIPKTTTHHPLRQFIPVQEKHGFAMVSYSDSQYASFWKSSADQGVDHLQKEILQQLQVVFPAISHIPSPQWLQSYYWPHGVHFWKTGVKSDVLAPKIQQILGEWTPFFIVGEAYAKNQGWIEGTLESVDAILPFIQKIGKINMQKQGGGNRYGGGNRSSSFAQWLLRRKNKISSTSLSHIREKFPDEKWVLLKHPNTGETVLVDVSEWMHRHPGGDVFSSKLYSDITADFYKIANHYSYSSTSTYETKNIQTNVLKQLETYIRAVVVS